MFLFFNKTLIDGTKESLEAMVPTGPTAQVPL